MDQKVKTVAKECKYQELDRRVKKQFICGINDQDMQRNIDNKIKVISNTDEIMSDQVLMWAKKEEGLRTPVLEAGQTKNEMRTVKTCKYCRSIHPPTQKMSSIWHDVW